MSELRTHKEAWEVLERHGVEGIGFPADPTTLSVAKALLRMESSLDAAVIVERTACAQAICTKCRDEGPAVWHEKSGKFAHDVFVCRADAIWKRGREKT